MCYLKEDQSEFLEERRLKDLVNYFAALTTSESVTQYTVQAQQCVEWLEAPVKNTHIEIRDADGTFFASIKSRVQCTIHWSCVARTR